MSNTKFCRTNRQCGTNSRCAGNLYGFKKGICTSVQGACRFDKNCPQYYQCVGNQSGLRIGKCLLSISKSNPLSKSVGNMSTSLLDPASIYRSRNSINFTFIVIALLILSGIVYFVYGFLKPPSLSPPGSCKTSQDCALNFKQLNNPLLFQCGKRIWSTTAPIDSDNQKPPNVIGTIPNKCDCTVLQGGGYNSGKNLWASGPSYDWSSRSYPPLIACCADQGHSSAGVDCEVPPSSTNCKKCKFGSVPWLISKPPASP